MSYLDERGIKYRPMLRSQLQEALVALDKRADEVMTGAKRTVIQQQPSSWQTFLEENSFFPTSLWALERICYCSLYYNYEFFLTECVRLKLCDPEYRMPRRDGFKDHLREEFGADIQRECWSDQSVLIARLARHALVHNGGRMTPQLQKQPHQFQINGGEIQVGAPHTTALFQLLKDKVTKISEAVLPLL